MCLPSAWEGLLFPLLIAYLLPGEHAPLMKKDKTRFRHAIEIPNKKARYHYEILETLTAGMLLEGSEIKSIRTGGASLDGAYCYFQGAGLCVKNMYIAPYREASFGVPEPRRDRKLLIHKREGKKWREKVQEKGLVIVPLRLFLSTRGWAKLDISLARGKRTHDKRESIKERDNEREMDRLKKHSART